MADEFGLRPRPRFGHWPRPRPRTGRSSGLVPPQPAEHLHQEADRAHVRRRLRPAVARAPSRRPREFAGRRERACAGAPRRRSPANAAGSPGPACGAARWPPGRRRPAGSRSTPSAIMPGDDLPALVGADDGEGPVAERPDPAGGDVGVLGGEVRARSCTPRGSRRGPLSARPRGSSPSWVQIWKTPLMLIFLMAPALSPYLASKSSSKMASSKVFEHSRPIESESRRPPFPPCGPTSRRGPRPGSSSRPGRSARRPPPPPRRRPGCWPSRCSGTRPWPAPPRGSGPRPGWPSTSSRRPPGPRPGRRR